jgi:predicted transcriptional regulator
MATKDKPTAMTATISISLPADMAEKIRQFADRERETVSRVIRTALEVQFGRGRGGK